MIVDSPRALREALYSTRMRRRTHPVGSWPNRRAGQHWCRFGQAYWRRGSGTALLRAAVGGGSGVVGREVRTMRVAMRVAGVASGSSGGAGSPFESSASTPDLMALAHVAARARPAARQRLADIVALAGALARTSRLGQAAEVIRLLRATDEQGQAWLSLIRQVAADGDHEAARALTDASAAGRGRRKA